MKVKTSMGKEALSAGLAALASFALLLAGCGEEREHAGHAHGVHVHVAPHGGALAMLGNHAFQLELVVNEQADRLELYVLDGEAENFVRISALEIAARAKAGERKWDDLRFVAVANEATGETKGSTAHFAAKGEGLVDEPEFEIHFDRIEILGRTFEKVTLPYPEGSH